MSHESHAEPSPQSIHVDGCTVSYTDEGQGRPLVALHGYPGSGRDFRWLAPHVVQSMRLIRLDMPGFGQTAGGPSDRVDPRTHCRLVIACVRALGLGRAVLLGHSMGGAVAVEAVLGAPELFSEVCLVASPGYTPHRHLRKIPVEFLSKVFRDPGRRRLLAPLVKLLIKPAGFSRSTPIEAIYRSIAFAAAYSPAAHALGLGAINVPCMVAYADDDGLVEPEIGRVLADRLPRGPRLCFPHGGHNLQKTRAKELADALVAWTCGSTVRA